jgi:phage head maturation protease
VRQESRLLEVSLTPTPAFASAEITMVRTAERPRPRGESKLDGWRRELERLRR